MKKYIALLLAICLALTLFGCTASGNTQTTTAADTTTATDATTTADTTVATDTATTAVSTESTDPMGGTYVDGIWKWNEPVEMTAFVRYNPDNTPDPQHGWWYEWIKDKMNIVLDVTGVTNDSAYERSALMVASGDLPNILCRWVFSTIAETELYGDKEKLLVPMNDYLTEEIMPNMCQIMEDFPTMKRDLSTSSGNIYLTTEVYENKEYTTQQWHEPAYYKISDLAAVGYENPPATTDELLDAARKLKELDPNGLGDDYYPLAGGY